MGYADKLQKPVETAGINPAFVRSIVAVTMEQLRQGLETQLAEPTYREVPQAEAYLKAQLAVLPQATHILTDAMELAVLGQFCAPERSMDAAPERFTLPKNSAAFAQRMAQAKRLTHEQLGMLELPEVPVELRQAVRETFSDAVFDMLRQRISLAAENELQFAQGAGAVPAGRF